VHSEKSGDLIVIADAAADAFDFVGSDGDAFGTATAEDAIFGFARGDIESGFLSEDRLID
jgi:hypothetical protein